MKRTSIIRGLVTSLAICAALVLASRAGAQVSAADSAAVLQALAERTAAQGNATLARELLRLVVREFPNTPAAAEARTLLSVAGRRDVATSGRSRLIVSNTLFGAWMGVAIPAALGAHSPSPYGAGLLIGAPTGFVSAKLFSDNNPMSSGQAIATTFGGWWGTWQGIGWREVLDIGTRQESYCYGEPVVCDTYESDSDEAPFAAAVIGGLGGLAAAGAMAQAFDPTAGAATTIQLSSFWGAWFGLSTAILADQHGDAELAWTLIGSNVGLVVSALATRDSDISSGRAWLVTAAGLAGGVAGLGVDLLAETDDAKSSIVAPMLMSMGGLALGFALTKDFDDIRSSIFERSAAGALVELTDGSLSIGPVLPTPTVVGHSGTPDGQRPRLGLTIPIFAGRF